MGGIFVNICWVVGVGIFVIIVVVVVFLSDVLGMSVIGNNLFVSFNIVVGGVSIIVKVVSVNSGGGFVVLVIDLFVVSVVILVVELVFFGDYFFFVFIFVFVRSLFV